MKFRKAEARPSFPKLEAAVLERWQQEKTFEASLEKSRGGKEFVFYDGPPFPTGAPHHGTLFVSILKDIIPRFKTMRGFYVPRTWGWDCHGLPIENLAEKNLGLTDKAEIESKLGIKAFNDECRRIVSECNRNWKIYIDRIGRWVDFDHPYSTRDRSFMESVMWAFSECYKKDLIYKDYRVSPYCYRCQTALSLSEARQDDSTRPRQDRALTVKFQVSGLEKTYLLAWTTTPWTLPSNLALAVGPQIPYVVLKHGDEKLILAADCVKNFKKELAGAQELERISGEELCARAYRYIPLFRYFSEKNPNGFCIIPADFVGLEEGTGIVHLAPAFGDDDYWACRKYNIALINPVDGKGNFSPEVTDFKGRNVHEANSDVARFLKGRGIVLRDETIEHAYPHCWRCRTPLIYKALDAWYFRVEAIKDRLIANNQKINWYPDSVKSGRFGKWLENARDWNISRNRYWATPIPVWECDSCAARDVYGSVAELERVAGQALPDIHKESLDPIRYSCSCGGVKCRTPEVLDCWFESGSMPYGQFHYPFENAEHFRSHFPGEFIVEYTPQIRGWFYVLHVLSTALFDSPAFENCLVHGTLLAADGKKMSKSLKNYTDPMALLDRHGTDAFRSYLLSSNSVQMADMNFLDDGVEGMVKSLSLPLWNALLFFTTYAEIDQVDSADIAQKPDTSELTELDRFILSETELLLSRVTEKLDSYMIHEAMRLLPEFLDTLNNWYIRRSRERVWVSDPRASDKMAFYWTLHRVLSRFTQILAPFCPFLAESVWQRLGFSESVHLSQWPTLEKAFINESLSEEIALVREIITAGLAIRAREKQRVRQPLAKLFLASARTLDFGRYGAAIKEELNIKELVQPSDVSEIATLNVKPNAKILGPKYGAAVQSIIKLAREGKFSRNPDGTVTIGEHTLLPEEIEIQYLGRDGMAVASTRTAVVALDTRVTPALALEGNARDLVRQVQELRKEADLNIADRIELSVRGADAILAAHEAYLKNETLSVSVTREALPNPLITKTIPVGDSTVEVALQRRRE